MVRVERRLAVSVLSLIAVVVWTPATSAGTRAPFSATISRLDADLREAMTGVSWHRGCPVSLDELRLIRLTYLGLDGASHRGQLIVHRRWADDIVAVFRRLYRAEFPIRRVRLIDRYDGDDRASMRRDNTSGFNCRYVAGTTTWSPHAYGLAIDVNPVENPYVDGSHVSPKKGEPYTDRSPIRPGMIAQRDVVWRAFHRMGWGWGGTWRSAQDYQHFSANGS